MPSWVCDNNTLDAWTLSVGLVSDVNRDVATYRSWHKDGMLPFNADVAVRGFFNNASNTIRARIGAYRSVNIASAAAGLSVARTLASHATMVSNWPGMRDAKGFSSEKLVTMATEEIVRIFSACKLTKRNVSDLSRVLRVDFVCGKSPAYIRAIDKVGTVVCGSKDAWLRASDPFCEAETLSAVSHLSAIKHVDSDTAARELASELVDITSVWDTWQIRHAPTGAFFDPDGTLGSDDGLTGVAGWCAAVSIHPIDSVLPMESQFRARAQKTYDAVMLAKRNAGKTWAQYR